MALVTCPHCGHVEEFKESNLSTNQQKYYCTKCWEGYSVEVKDNIPKVLEVPASATLQGNTPWEMRAGGFFEDLFLSIFMILIEPSDFFRKMSPNSELKKPIVFALMTNLLTMALFLFWYVIFSIPEIDFSKPWFNLVVDPNLTVFEMLILLSLDLLVWPVASLFILSAVVHVLLKIVGSGNGGYRATFHVYAYLTAIGVLTIIPIFRIYILVIWGFVVLITGLSRVHSTGKLRIAAAVLGMPIAGCFLLMIILVVVS